MARTDNDTWDLASSVGATANGLLSLMTNVVKRSPTSNSSPRP